MKGALRVGKCRATGWLFAKTPATIECAPSTLYKKQARRLYTLLRCRTKTLMTWLYVRGSNDKNTWACLCASAQVDKSTRDMAMRSRVHEEKHPGYRQTHVEPIAKTPARRLVARGALDINTRRFRGCLRQAPAIFKTGSGNGSAGQHSTRRRTWKQSFCS